MYAIVFPPLEKCPTPELTDVQKRILELKKERNAVILAHNYVCREIQEVADFVGDSLGLSREAKKTDAKVIAFAGVDFMAETAKILNPDKTVVLPDHAAGCTLEELCEPIELALFKKQHPDALVISYINCSAGVKEISDIICTSGNALDIVKQIPPEREIIFCPDQHLGSWIVEQTGRKMLLWHGYCWAHSQYKAKELLEIKRAFDNAPLVCHPECPKEVRDVADCVCSTEKMIKFCRENPSDKCSNCRAKPRLPRKNRPLRSLVSPRSKLNADCRRVGTIQRRSGEQNQNASAAQGVTSYWGTGANPAHIGKVRVRAAKCECAGGGFGLSPFESLLRVRLKRNVGHLPFRIVPTPALCAVAP